MELSLPVFTTKVFHGWDSNTQPPACGAMDLTHYATAPQAKENNQVHEKYNLNRIETLLKLYGNVDLTFPV